MLLSSARLEKEGNKDLKLSVPQHNINKIQNTAISATEYLSTVVAAGVSGAAAGFAVYSGVMAFAAASTGTPIAALSGAAAYNATMAAIGGAHWLQGHGNGRRRNGIRHRSGCTVDCHCGLGLRQTCDESS